MTSEERALATFNAMNGLNMEMQALTQRALHQPVTVGELRDMLKKMAHAGYLASRTLCTVRHEDGRRMDDTRPPPFDDAEVAQQQTAPSMDDRPVAESIGAAVRRALVREGQS